MKVEKIKLRNVKSDHLYLAEVEKHGDKVVRVISLHNQHGDLIPEKTITYRRVVKFLSGEPRKHITMRDADGHAVVEKLKPLFKLLGEKKQERKRLSKRNKN